MIIVIFLVCVGILLLGIWLENDFCCETTSGSLICCGGFGTIISFIALIVLLINVSGLKTLDAQIEMYQSENSNIETQIADCVKQYQQYENEIFTEVAPDSAITLVALYPELKADTLVAKQVEIYVANNEKIKELKEQKITGDVVRWWAYFGGDDNAQ